MKYKYLFSLIIIFSIFTSCKSDDPTPIEEETYFISFSDSKGDILSSRMNLLNGQKIFPTIETHTTSNVYDSGSIEIKNISNNNVSIYLTKHNSIIIKTNELTNQTVLFDIYFKQKFLTNVSVTLKSLYKLSKDGMGLPNDFVLSFEEDYILPKELKIVKIDNSEIQEFDYQGVSFLSTELNEEQSNYKTYSGGQNFKVVFYNSEELGNEFATSLYYRSEETNYIGTYIGDIKVKTNQTLTESSCKIVVEKETKRRLSNDAQSGITQVFYINNEKLVGLDILTNISSEKDNIIYKTDNLIEVYDPNFDLKYSFYYNDEGKIEQITHFENYKKTFYYDDLSNLIGESIYKTKDQGSFVITDSIAYSDFGNNLPAKIIEYSYEPNSTKTSPLFYKVEYDIAGNIIKKEISHDDITFYPRYEATYDDEKILKHFSLETGEIMVEKYLLLSEYYFPIKDLGYSVSMTKTLQELKRDVNNNILILDYRVEFSDNGEYEYLYEYTYTNEDCNTRK